MELGHTQGWSVQEEERRARRSTRWPRCCRKGPAAVKARRRRRGGSGQRLQHGTGAAVAARAGGGVRAAGAAGGGVGCLRRRPARHHSRTACSPRPRPPAQRRRHRRRRRRVRVGVLGGAGVRRRLPPRPSLSRPAPRRPGESCRRPARPPRWGRSHACPGLAVPSARRVRGGGRAGPEESATGRPRPQRRVQRRLQPGQRRVQPGLRWNWGTLSGVVRSVQEEERKKVAGLGVQQSERLMQGGKQASCPARADQRNQGSALAAIQESSKQVQQQVVQASTHRAHPKREVRSRSKYARACHFPRLLFSQGLDRLLSCRSDSNRNI